MSFVSSPQPVCVQMTERRRTTTAVVAPWRCPGKAVRALCPCPAPRGPPSPARSLPATLCQCLALPGVAPSPRQPGGWATTRLPPPAWRDRPVCWLWPAPAPPGEPPHPELRLEHPPEHPPGLLLLGQPPQTELRCLPGPLRHGKYQVEDCHRTRPWGELCVGPVVWVFLWTNHNLGHRQTCHDIKHVLPQIKTNRYKNSTIIPRFWHKVTIIFPDTEAAPTYQWLKSLQVTRNAHQKSAGRWRCCQSLRPGSFGSHWKQSCENRQQTIK